MTKRSGFFTILVALLSAGGCFFAFSGTGEYSYNGEVGDPDSTFMVEEGALLDITIIEVDPVTLDPIPETLDDEFDLLDDEPEWSWSETFNFWVYIDSGGTIHYGTS